MSEVFISWGSPDKSTVEHLCARLLDMGVDFFQYSRDMDAGDAISSRVAAEIRQAKVAILCLSDMSAQREWILTEVALLHEAREQKTLEAILPVKVGPLEQTSVPKLIQSADASILDLGQEGEGGIEKLLRAVRKHLGLQQAPLVLPAMLFAMTAAQFDEVVQNAGIRETLVEVCRHLGMVGPEDGSGALLSLLRRRYGDRAEDFSPFGSDRPLIQTVRGAIRQLNHRRVAEERPPIFDRWLNEDFFGEDPRRRDMAGRLWLRSSPLLIIDSLSMSHPEIFEQLRDLSYQQDRMAVVWIPPYTQRTGELETKIAEDMDVIRQLGDFFREWMDRERSRELPVLWGAFDVAIETTLWHWLYRMCDALVDRRLDESALQDMNSRYSVSISTNHFYRRSAGSGPLG